MNVITKLVEIDFTSIYDFHDFFYLSLAKKFWFVYCKICILLIINEIHERCGVRAVAPGVGSFKQVIRWLGRAVHPMQISASTWLPRGRGPRAGPVSLPCQACWLLDPLVSASGRVGPVVAVAEICWVYLIIKQRFCVKYSSKTNKIAIFICAHFVQTSRFSK